MTTLSCATTRKPPSFPAYLRLTRLPSTYLTPKQSSEAKRLLKEYEGLFAASDSDYGRKSVVKHNIATRSAHPKKTTTS
jgi:hypothetical protein